MEEQFKKVWKKEDESALREKHVPVVIIEEGKIEVKVGSVEHPMLPEHFIQWITIFDGEIELAKINLTHLIKPEVVFFIKEKISNLRVRIFCNIHGTWEYS